MSYVMVVLIWIQSASGIMPTLSRAEVFNSAVFESKEACQKAGESVIGPVMSETDSLKQYTWQNVSCVAVN